MSLKNIPELRGQERLLEFMEHSLKTGRLPHALILSGPKGCGKLAIAKGYALSALLASGNEHPDIRILDLTEPGARYVDIIRKGLVDNIIIGPYHGDYKFYIIVGAGNMPPEAQNAILKSLEEPPGYAVIIMLTEDASKLLPTIRSRSIKLFVKPIETDFIVDLLIKDQIRPDKARLAAALSFGSLKLAKDIADDEEYVLFAEEVVRAVSGIAMGEAPVSYSEQLKDFTKDFDKFLELMEIILRDVLVYKESGAENLILPWPDYIKTISGKCSYERLGAIRECIWNCYQGVTASVSKDVLLDLLLVEIGG